MSKKLAIKGHSTRGNEVIEILEMMGGKNSRNFDGSANMYSYYIFNNTILSDRLSILEDDDFEIFTLQSFLEKYPFKVGDIVDRNINYVSCVIDDMRWNSEKCYVEYHLIYLNGSEYGWHVSDCLIKPEMGTKSKNSCANCVFAVLDDKPHCGLRGFTDKFNIKDCSAENSTLPNGYELQEDGYFSWVNKKSKYPKTVIEVLDYWHPNRKPEDSYQYIYKKDLIKSFQLLLYCRDAYWKIAGEEMGLGKPWEPDWYSIKQSKFGIHTVENQIKYITLHVLKNLILVFPTEEMRDAFYENFKDLIESCKELL